MLVQLFLHGFGSNYLRLLHVVALPLSLGCCSFYIGSLLFCWLKIKFVVVVLVVVVEVVYKEEGTYYVVEVGSNACCC